MIAAAGAGMAAIDHEFVGAEPRLTRFLVDAAVVMSTHSRQHAAG